MAYNPNEHDLVMRERRADALRDAEHWRLLKSVQRQGKGRSWLGRLWARKPRVIHLPRERDVPLPSRKSRPSSSRSHT